MSATAQLEPFTVNLRIKISALWTSMLLMFVYVDLFSFYRPDFRAAVEAGTVGGFSVGQLFLLGTTAYVAVPTLMIFATLALRPMASRYINIAVSSLYAVTIVIAAIGEWNYYLLGSALEVLMLAAIVYYAWTWPVAARS